MHHVWDQLISIDAEDPKYHADLLSKIPRIANRRLQSDEQSCPDVPGIENVDIALTRRLQTLLDAVADISLFRLLTPLSFTPSSLFLTP
jgi:hypothetical protein